MARHADGAGVVGKGPLDSLADPPGRIGAELVAQAMFELVHGPHQTAIAFLDQVGERQTPAAIALGDGDHQPQVGLGQFAAVVLINLAPFADDFQQPGQVFGVGLGFEDAMTHLLAGPHALFLIAGRPAWTVGQTLALLHVFLPGGQLKDQRIEQFRPRRQLRQQGDPLAQLAKQIAALARLGPGRLGAHAGDEVLGRKSAAAGATSSDCAACGPQCARA